MSRRIFEEKNFNIFGKVLPYSEFKPFINLEGGFVINDEQKPRLVNEAEKMLDREIPQLYAHEYMMFRRKYPRCFLENQPQYVYKLIRESSLPLNVLTECES